MANLFARLSTGMKMLIILSAALLPLGLIALLASVQSAENNRQTRNAASRLLATDAADRVNMLIARTAVTMRAASTAFGDALPGSPTCQRTIEALAASHRLKLRFAIFNASGQLVCAVRGYRPAVPTLALADASRTDIAPGGDGLLLVTRAASGDALGVAQLPAAVLTAISHPHVPPGSYFLAVREGATTLTLATITSRPIGKLMTISAPFARARLTLVMTIPETPISSTEMLVIVLPVLMWLAAAIIGWLVVDRLLLRPLTRLQAAISAYAAGDARITIPALTTPAIEIRQLGESFRGVALTVARHEAELEEGIMRQTRLTREVHHRVKNNLQVVASLLSLHARGAKSVDIAAAYASIQRRVDALAIVHRNHYAELEESRGVALRPLIAELAANLRGSMPDDAKAPAILLDLKPFYATQDVAVSVAFLITELVEMALLCAPASRVAVHLAATERGDRARLAVNSPALRPDACGDQDVSLRFRRVIEGLSRQLRSALMHDEDCIAIEIAVIGDAAAEEGSPRAAA
ncbi:MAG: sensor histidine kinase [Sphingomonadaceae bacterium]|nr:sensor histidine kinase [Sphingomonadaceae bacterium]